MNQYLSSLTAFIVQIVRRFLISINALAPIYLFTNIWKVFSRWWYKLHRGNVVREVLFKRYGYCLTIFLKEKMLTRFCRLKPIQLMWLRISSRKNGCWQWNSRPHEAGWRIYPSLNWVIIDSGSGLSPFRQLTIAQTNAEIKGFYLTISSVKWGKFYCIINVFITPSRFYVQMSFY